MQRVLAERELTVEGAKRTGSAKGKRRTVTLNLAELPISWLHARGHLDDRLFAAGELLRRDYEYAQLSPSITMRWEAERVDCSGKVGGGMTSTERQLSAKDRFDGAMKEAGRGLQDILWRVVCGCESLPHAEKRLGWPTRSGKLVLRLALDRVADFYRVP